MFHNTCNKCIGIRTQSKRIVCIIKSVFAAFKERHIGMHTAATDTANRLWHKRSVKPVTLCIRLNNIFKGHYIIRSCQHFIKSKIYFMLTFCNLVVRRFDFIAKTFQCQADVTSAIFA
ncbi:hypothetical protein SDC9_133813 [bioreactor metagenome]|uniref:Uncharacterized protein n=1 Tax=bioreactor metagenome TaxID=1076179 RepID=A0A645DDT2_9ZZZZ